MSSLLGLGILPSQLAYSRSSTRASTDLAVEVASPRALLAGLLLSFLVACAKDGWAFRQSRTQFGRIGVAALSVYLALCLTAQGFALGLIKQFSQERGIQVWRRAAGRMGCASLVGPLRWTGLVLAASHGGPLLRVVLNEHYVAGNPINVVNPQMLNVLKGQTMS